MYSAYFDFREKPFKLVPNPAFLFLGKSHEEALAHLIYAVSQGDGFVEITGEVGTGKTTLCRAFLEDLDRDIEAAFIFNSKLDSTQLLKAIHRELGIEGTALETAGMTLELNEFLLDKKARGKSVILLIDEAQNLGRETLEQVRLLSNLETTQSKLLQIILVGQPELGEILESHDLRQLRQRINLSCHILPMTRKETSGYIEHRVNTASRKSRALFTRGAQQKIYDYSHGIPRRINIVCDRSLLVAYTLNKKKVTSSMVRIAIHELAPYRVRRPGFPSFVKLAAWAGAFMMLAAFLLPVIFREGPFIPIAGIKSAVQAIHIPGSGNQSPGPLPPLAGVQSPVVPKESEEPELLRPEPVEVKSVKPGLKEPGSLTPKSLESGLSPALPEVQVDIKENLLAIPNAGTREQVFAHVAFLWDNQAMALPDPLTEKIESDIDFFRIAAAQRNLKILYLKEDLALILKYNLPVILGLGSSDDPVQGYISIDEVFPDNTYKIFPGNGNGLTRITSDRLKPFLTGRVYIPWKDDFGYGGTISETSSRASIVMLKILLRQIGFSSIDLTPVYDDSVREAVQQIQAKYGLVVDGKVGPLTKIILHSEKRQEGTPCLDRKRFKPKGPDNGGQIN
jgi:general secretion pathway protein A